MREETVTSFSPAGEAAYGRRMVKSCVQHVSAPLVAYTDAPTRLPVETRFTSTLHRWVECRKRWAHDPVVQGISTPKVPRSKPYAYRFDANRFAIKVFVWLDAAQRLRSGVLTWLDGDTEAVLDVPAGFFTGLLGDSDVAYLGRGSMHPETGYVGFRIPEALPLLEWCAQSYSSEGFRSIETGWTDCHVLRAGIEATSTKAVNLTADRYAGVSHVWPMSPLAPYLTHYKGARKRLRAIAC